MDGGQGQSMAVMGWGEQQGPSVPVYPLSSHRIETAWIITIELILECTVRSRGGLLRDREAVCKMVITLPLPPCTRKLDHESKEARDTSSGLSPPLLTVLGWGVAHTDSAAG